MKKLRTARARLLNRALQEGFVHQGNHEIKVEGTKVTFYFRGTPITVWDTSTQEILQDAHGYNTVSTADNQRKNENAILEYRGQLS
jgi:hypothetical protein